MTWASIGINFLPLMFCLTVFLPLEDWVAGVGRRTHVAVPDYRPVTVKVEA